METLENSIRDIVPVFSDAVGVLMMKETFWGRSEVFWVGVQAVSAILAFVVVFFYTLYTRKMMRLAEETRRLAVTPIFSAKEWDFLRVLEPATSSPSYYTVTYQIQNIGQGPAVLLHAWQQSVSDTFNLRNATILNRTANSQECQPSKRDLLSHEVCQVQFDAVDIARPWLLVLESTDTANGRHQLQILSRPVHDGGMDVNWVMNHSLGETFGERIVSFAQRYVQIINSLDKISKDLFN